MEIEPTLEELLDEYSNSMADLRSEYEIKLTYKNTENLALDVAIGVEYIGGDLPGTDGENTAHADLSEKYTVLNWSNREIDTDNLPEDFSTVTKVFDSKVDTQLEGKEVGIDYDNLLVVRVVDGIVDAIKGIFS